MADVAEAVRAVRRARFAEAETEPSIHADRSDDLETPG
jgi:hypothetical protein